MPKEKELTMKERMENAIQIAEYLCPELRYAYHSKYAAKRVNGDVCGDGSSGDDPRSWWCTGGTGEWCG